MTCKIWKWIIYIPLLIGGIDLGLMGLLGDYNLLQEVFGTDSCYRAALMVIGLCSIVALISCCCCRKKECKCGSNCNCSCSRKPPR